MRIEVQEVSLAGDEADSYLRVPLIFPNDILPSPLDWKVLTLVRVKPTWIHGEVYSSLSGHPCLASSLLLFKSPDKWDETIAVYPAGSLGVNANLVVDAGKREVQANIRSVTPGGKGKAVIVCVRASGAIQERAVVAKAVEAARKLLGGRPHQGGGNDFWDELGVCTWESFREGDERTRPSKDMLLGLVPDLPIKSFLIDDGWQDTRTIRLSRGEKKVLYSFEGWDGMGSPMHDVVSSLKKKGVEKVGVWLTLQGYWCGIHPDSPLIKKYDCQAHPSAAWGQPRGGVNVPLEKGDWEQWLPSLDKAGQFWEDWFTEMKSWGVGFLKVDNQAHYDAITGPQAAAVHQAMWSGMLAAFEKVWHGDMSRLIMCMSHNECMLNGAGGLDFDRPPGNLVFRNSDDFNMSFGNNHTHFAHWNLYMSILTSHLSLVRDYDMFSTNPGDRWPLYNALLRSLSPGPILLSDAHGVKSDRALLDRMTAKDRSGRVKVVRTDTAVTALAGRWFWDNLQGSDNGPALVGGVSLPQAKGALLGVWNGRDADSDARAIDHIGAQDVADVLSASQGEQGEYALYTLGLSKENGRKVSLVDLTRDEGKGMPMKLELNKGECELVIVAKVWHLSGKKVALVGMLDKLAPLAGIEVVGVQHDEIVVKVTYETEQLSVLVFADESVPTDSFNVSVNGKPRTLDGGTHTNLPFGARLCSVTVGGDEGLTNGGAGAYEVRWKIM